MLDIKKEDHAVVCHIFSGKFTAINVPGSEFPHFQKVVFMAKQVCSFLFTFAADPRNESS